MVYRIQTEPKDARETVKKHRADSTWIAGMRDRKPNGEKTLVSIYYQNVKHQVPGEGLVLGEGAKTNTLPYLECLDGFDGFLAQTLSLVLGHPFGFCRVVVILGGSSR